ncbi:MAG: transglutaminase domain-containing protein [Clostridiaceae bacterium]|nr:transglutaminase domain-containing protein [Clostridiaceae bacterium]
MKKNMPTPRRVPARKKKRPLPLFLAVVALLIVAAASYLVYTNSIVNQSVVIEAGSSLPAAAAFIKNDTFTGEYMTDISGINTAVTGKYDLQIKVNGRTYKVSLEIVDTTPPTAKPVNQEIWQNETLPAAQFISDPTDISELTYAYKNPPDFAKPGLQNVTVILADTSGNTSEITASLNILADTEAPVISGAADQSIFIGDTISYRKDVTVTDNHDADVQLSIDNSAVNLAAAGTYPVVYSAVDKSGNKAEVTVQITVAAKPDGYISEDELNVLVDQILGEIIKPGMSDLDKISEIFYWIAGHIDYTGHSDKSDWIKGAYTGITKGTGDCFNYFATAKALLTRAGFECIPIERVANAKTRHYWNLVKYNGQYYHFDPLPNLAKYHYVCLLRTDAEVAAYTADNHPLFYEYDHTGIPASATEPLDIERKVIYG